MMRRHEAAAVARAVHFERPWQPPVATVPREVADVSRTRVRSARPSGTASPRLRAKPTRLW
jgi:hypothetical protein